MSAKLAAFAATLLVSSSALAQHGGDRAYCYALMDQYDRYAPRMEGTTAPGRIDREVGAERCRSSRTAEGERILQDAVRSLGFEPVERPR